jgi:hypothetical protein
MSANRSVQAAQRRRAGPTSEPGIPGRGPQPSINSAQLFSNQARTGQGPNMPIGRLAGQQAEMQQKQQMQQRPSADSLSSVSKMTIAQAITLITLRLGAVETKLINFSGLQEGGPQQQSVPMDGQDMVLIDKNVLQSITSRLESLEKRSGSVAGSASGPEMNLLKQQFETVKQAVVQTKTATTTVIKESKDLKVQVDALKNELTETKELLNALQNLTMDNTQKIMDLSTEGFGSDYNQGFNETLGATTNFTSLTDLNDDSEQNEIVGTNLKELIESEMNSSI